MRSSLFLDVMHHRVIVTDVSGQTINGQAVQEEWTAWPLKMGPISCPETSVPNYQSTLCDIPEEWRSCVRSSVCILCNFACVINQYILNIQVFVWNVCVCNTHFMCHKPFLRNFFKLLCMGHQTLPSCEVGSVWGCHFIWQLLLVTSSWLT